MSAAAMPFPLPDARLAAMLAEGAPFGDLTTQGLGVGDTAGRARPPAPAPR